MLFNVRGKTNNHNRTIRIHAENTEEAEKIAFGRGLFVMEVTPVYTEVMLSSKLDRVADVMWQAWQSVSLRSMKCYGREVTSEQFNILALLGCATWIVDLRAFHFA